MLEELNIQRLLIFIVEQIMASMFPDIIGFLLKLRTAQYNKGFWKVFTETNFEITRNMNPTLIKVYNNVLDTISFDSLCRNNSNYKGICWDLTFDLPWSFIHLSLCNSEYKQQGPWHWTRSLMWNQDVPKLRTRERTPTSFPVTVAEEQGAGDIKTPVARSCQGAHQAKRQSPTVAHAPPPSWPLWSMNGFWSWVPQFSHSLLSRAKSLCLMLGTHWIPLKFYLQIHWRCEFWIP